MADAPQLHMKCVTARDTTKFNSNRDNFPPVYDDQAFMLRNKATGTWLTVEGEDTMEDSRFAYHQMWFLRPCMTPEGKKYHGLNSVVTEYALCCCPRDTGTALVKCIESTNAALLKSMEIAQWYLQVNGADVRYEASNTLSVMVS
ncbi:hypothetical protein FE257_002926 [Aspergillus nanangensis]|uniref:Uncharacterized protein n=1 Tax=Aspergillus nanangensis TaxID=2582783 RepID=A0AAD4CUE4_ASPNN|nr:hypothetical protein FE257_002926 [Aspergillus nanangensis]